MQIEDLATKPKDFKVKGKYVVRTPTDQLRVRLEKMMENPEKPVPIPAPRVASSRSLAETPVFVRNVMGSSAGAGSGEFHVYRHLRRKEFARQKEIQGKSRREELDEQFAKKLEDNRQLAESKTAKKRAKRQKKKAQRKNRPAQRSTTTNDAEESASESAASDTDEEGQAAVEANEQPNPVETIQTDGNDSDEVATVAERPATNDDEARQADGTEAANDGSEADESDVETVATVAERPETTKETVQDGSDSEEVATVAERPATFEGPEAKETDDTDDGPTDAKRRKTSGNGDNEGVDELQVE